MPNTIHVTPNAKGEIIVTLYGTEYHIVVDKKPKKAAKSDEPTEPVKE